jgi:5-deoxy-glucuronate isomerase
VSDLLVASKQEPDQDGSVVKVSPQSAGWDWVGFEVLRLGAGRSVERRAGGEEVCLVVLSGRCAVSTGNDGWEIGGRESVFDGPPHALYLPPETWYRVEATTDLELAVCSAPAQSGAEARLIEPGDVEVEVRG